jgi:hypothetical protein
MDFAGLGKGLVTGFCEHGNEPSGSIKKAGYFLQAEYLSTFQKISCTIE